MFRFIKTNTGKTAILLIATAYFTAEVIRNILDPILLFIWRCVLWGSDFIHGFYSYELSISTIMSIVVFVFFGFCVMDDGEKQEKPIISDDQVKILKFVKDCFDGVSGDPYPVYERIMERHFATRLRSEIHLDIDILISKGYLYHSHTNVFGITNRGIMFFRKYAKK